MKRILALLICVIFLVTGLIRVAVSAVVIGELTGWSQFGGEAALAVADTQRFIAEAQVNLASFTPLTYFVFLMFMGLVVSAGAIGQVWRKNWGLALIGLYVCCHAFLFVNFMTINPKAALLGIALVLALVLAWANTPAKPAAEPAQ